MTMSERLFRMAPWAGLVVGPSAWALHHQLGSNLNFADCRTGTGAVVVGLGVVCALACLAGGLASWFSGAADRTSPETDVRRFIAILGAASAGVFLMAITLQTLAGFLVPACHR